MKNFKLQIIFSAVIAMTAIVGFSAHAETLPNNVGAEYVLKGLPEKVEFDNNRRLAYALPFMTLSEYNEANPLAGMADLKVTWGLGELSADGQYIQLEMDLRSEGLRRILPSGRNLFRMKGYLNIKNCDEKSPSRLSPAASESIEQVIASFSQYKYSEYMRCTLDISIESSSEDMANLNGSTFYLNSKGTWVDADFLDDGDIIVRSDEMCLPGQSYCWARALHSRYVRAGQPLNSADDQAAEQAARTFTSLLKRYGQTLVDLRARNATPVQKRAALQGFFNQNKAGFVSSLQQVNALFGKLSLMSKVRIIQSIQDGYSYVHYLENKIATEPMFDSVVNINLP